FGPIETAREYWAKDDANFRSETGMPGASDLALMKKYAGDEKLWPPAVDNPFWQHTSLWWLQYELFKRELKGRKPKAALRKFVKLSQTMQAEILEMAARSCKSRFPACGAFIVWMGHDAFPTMINTSVVDFDGNPKPAYYALQRVFKGK